MFIVSQDKALVNIDRVVYIGVDDTILIAETEEDEYRLGKYITREEAERKLKQIRRGIEEEWRICVL